MKAPENGEFKRDENGILTDLQEALWVIHELACMLGELAEDQKVRMMVGPDIVIAHMAAIGAHELSCDKHRAEPEKSELKGPLPGFNLGDDLNKLIGDL